MNRLFDRSGSFVAFKADSLNQVIIYDLKKLSDQRKVIECESQVQDFTINNKDKFALIVLDNRRLILYDVTLWREIEHRNQIKYFTYQILFLHLGAVWMGNYESGELCFHIQAFNDFSHTTATSSAVGKFESAAITSYKVNQDVLICGYRTSDEPCLIVRYQLLDSREIKQRKVWEIGVKSLDFLELNNTNSLILFVTDTGSIGIIDDEHIVMCELFSNGLAAIRSVTFDLNQSESFCVATAHSVHFCFYHQEKDQCFRHDSVAISDDSLLVAYQLPSVYLVRNGEMFTVKNRDLECYNQNVKSIQEMISSESEQFKRFLYSRSDQDASIWRIMAKRCVLERDLDGALVCASKMREAALVRCLKQEMDTSRPVALFLMALHLNLTEESETILEEVDQGEKSRLYRLQDKWPEAFGAADKIELKNLYYQYAKQLESENKLNEAIDYYERSGNKSRVLLMLFETENLAELRSYCLRKNKDGQVDPKLVSWWGQYSESLGDNSTAVEMYKMANDYYNLVRILCHLNEMEQAINLIDSFLDSSGSEKNSDMTAAVLFLGKHLEGIDPIQSVKYYLECGAIRHAFRVCALHQQFDLMVKIAVQHGSLKEAQNILNTYFPREEDFLEKDVSEEHAAMLYYKCDRLASAISFAIKHRLWNFLRTMLAEELEKPNRRSMPADPEQLESILEYLKQDTSIVDIVIDLILMSEQENFETITRIINQYGIEFSDSLMAKLETFVAKHHNQALVNSIAELCLEKGNYPLAAKLYNKIGNRVEAIKALIRTGHEDKIIQFANVARDKTVYKLAANFLQTINHPDSGLVMRFYTKADAHQELERYKKNLGM